MTLKHLALLKISWLSFLGMYMYSFTWISIMYLYGFLYRPINDTVVETYVQFPYFVNAISLVGLLLILFKTNGNTFLKVLVQDFGIIIISVPFYANLLGMFAVGVDDPDSPITSIVAICVLTALTVVFNDRKKTKNYLQRQSSK